MKIPLLSTLFVLLTAQFASAQSAPVSALRTDLISPSPTAASITRYGEISVNQSSGSNNFSISLFNVAGNELSVPISLGYGFTGLRPAEPTGWAGLGWSVQSGGVITRSVRGKVDNSFSATGFESEYVRDKIFNSTDVSSTSFQTFLENAYGGQYDTEPDIYSFSFNGNSGRFIVYRGKCIVYPSQNIKIYDNGNSFLIVTADGTRYTFADTEVTRTKASSNLQYNPPIYVSSWYLSSIENAPRTETISFSYAQEPEVSQLGARTQSFTKYHTNQHGENNMLSDFSNAYPTFVRPLRLAGISAGKFSADFLVQPSARTDVPNSHALSTIVIRDQIGNRTIKSFRFHTSYLNGSVLKLDSLEERQSFDLGSTGVLRQVHRFEYESENAVPGRETLALDHFGYYNGANNNTSLIPSTIYAGSFANREPNASYAKAGALSKVTYPTGGHTMFEYEGNIANDGQKYQLNQKQKIAFVNQALYGGSSIPAYFALNHPQTITVDVQRTRIGEPSGDNNIRGTKDFELFRLENGSWISVGMGRLVLEDENFPFSFTVPAGSYYIEVYLDNRESEMQATVHYTEQTDIPIEGKLAGGIRIRQLTNVPLVGEPIVKSYSYVDDQGFSTGFGGDVVYSQSNFEEVLEEPAGGYYTRSSTTYTPYVVENTYTSVPNFYTRVTENLHDGADRLTTTTKYQMGAGYNASPFLTGTVQYRGYGINRQPIRKTELSFMMAQDTVITAIRPLLEMQAGISGVGVGWGYPGPLKRFVKEDLFYDQGSQFPMVKREVAYEAADSLVTTTNYQYNFVGSKRVAMERTSSSDGSQLISKMKYAEDYVSSVSATAVDAYVVGPIWEQQTWRKSPLGDSVLIAANATAYNSQFRPQAVYALHADNVTALNNEGRTGNRYNNLLSDNRFEPKATFGYDADGKLVTQKLEGGISHSYQWGYGGPAGVKQYPIAEIKNALPSEFHVENFEEYSGAMTGTAHSGSRFFVGDFPVGWTVPNSRTYVLSYWYRAGGRWNYHEQPYSGAVTLTLGDAIDDVRIYPKDALLNTYVHETGIGQSAVIDAKGLTSYYEYDELLRLVNIKDNDGNIIKNYRYNVVSRGLFYSARLSAPFIRNNCGAGQMGNAVIYTMPAGEYASAVSQADADLQASSAFAVLGQAHANANGTCTTGTALTFQNWTEMIGGVYTGRLTNIQFRDANNVTLYSFNAAAINAGFSVPQGTYNILATIEGQLYELYTPFGWGFFTITVGSTTHSFGRDTTSFMLNNVVVTGATGTISLYSYMVD